MSENESGRVNGSGGYDERAARRPTHHGAPAKVIDLAEACVKFVERAIGIKLDYEPETLGVLDHWLRQTRDEAGGKPEVAIVAAHAAGAYFGELVRKRYSAWWRVENDDPSGWRVEFEEVYLAFNPVLLMADAVRITAGDEYGDNGGLQLEDDDRDAVAQRLAELPEVTEAEYYAPTTRLEVIDVAVEAIRARRIALNEPVADALRPEDYDEE